METVNSDVQPNEIPSLQELCIPPVARMLNTYFDDAPNKQQFINQVARSAISALPVSTSKKITKKMVEKDLHFARYFPPTVAKKLDTNNVRISFSYDPSGKELIVCLEEGRLLSLNVQTLEKKCLRTMDHVFNSTVFFSDDRQKIAWHDYGDEIKVFDNKQNTKTSISGHDDTILAIAFNKNGNLLFSSSCDRTVRIWDLEKYDTADSFVDKNGLKKYSICKSEHILSHENMLYSFCVHPNGRELAAGEELGTVTIWTIKNGKRTTNFDSQCKFLKALCYNKSGSQCATGGIDGIIRLWKSTDYNLEHVLQGHEGSVESIDYNHAGTQLISTGKDKTVRFWDPYTGNFLYLIKPAVRYRFSIACSPDDSQVAVAPCDHTMIHFYNWDHEAEKLATLSPEQFLVLRFIFLEKNEHCYFDEQLVSIYNKLPIEIREQLNALNKQILSDKATHMHSIL
jgi:WD40 repeat protein